MPKNKTEAKTVADYPELIKQWHPTKNRDLTPDMITAGSSKKVWWKCPQGLDHEWITAVKDRTRKDGPTGCPCCANKKISVTNSLATLFPEIAKEWHPTKNGGLTPADVIAGSSEKVWWKCPKGPDHEWITTVNSRTYGKSGCPCCAGQKVSVTNSLATLFPEIAKEWHPTKNGELTPEEVSYGSKKKVWWKCPQGPDHEWEAKINHRSSKESGCPYCDGKRVSVTNSLATLFPEIAKEWHPTKNGELTPNDVIAGSSEKVWWKCPKGPDHEWAATLNNRTTGKSGCPCCAGQKISVTNSLATLFPEIAKEWHPTKNRELTPDKITAGSSKKLWWKCSKGPDHEWDATIVHRTNSKSGCPYCNIGDVELIGRHWERICYRIAQQLLKEEKWSWQPRINTPDFDEKHWIAPDILIEKPDGTFVIIEAKKTPYILMFKDLVIYPQHASKVIVWYLEGESPIEIDSEENFVFISSNELVEQLKLKITVNNRRTISKIISDIKKLKEGTLLTQQKSLTEFIFVNE